MDADRAGAAQIQNVLEMKDLGALVTRSGRAAITHVKLRLTLQLPIDAIFISEYLPDIDGIEAITNIRNAGYTGPIIGVADGSGSGPDEASWRGGCDALLETPVASETLAEMIRGGVFTISESCRH